MAAGRIILEAYFPARDRNDVLVAGARLRVLVNRTSNTNAPIYADSGLTTPLANPVIANASGRFPDIWAERGSFDAPTLYTLAVSGPSGENIGNPSVFDDFQPSARDDAAESAAAAEVAKEQAEAYLNDINVGLLSKTAKSANGSDFANTDAVRTNIGAVSQPELDAVRIVAEQSTVTKAVATVADLSTIATPAAGDSARVTDDPLGDVTDGNGVWSYDGAGWVWIGPWAAPATLSQLEANAAMRESFVEAPSLNLADPARTDPAIATSDDQRWRYYGNIAGNMVAQNEATQGTFGVMKRLPVTAGQQYTHSLKQGPSNFIHYPLSGVSLLFLKADGTTRILESASVSGLNTHTVTFTAPAEAVWWLGTIRNFTNYGNGSGLTSSAIEAVESAAMFNAGATALDYVPYAAPGALVPNLAKFTPETSTPITLEIRSDYTYVGRSAGASATYDIVDRLLTNEVAAYTPPGLATKTGIIDFQGRRRILKNRRQRYMVADFNVGTVLTIGTDERTPIRLNGVFLGGGHGPNGYEITKADHGKTNQDVGSTYMDTAGKVWMIVRVVSSSKLVIVATNTGTSDKWIVAGALTGTTLTHVANGTNTATLTGVTAAATFANQIIRNLDKKIYADGVEVSAEGVYPCSTLRMVESYEIMNVAIWLGRLQAHAGTATDPDYTNSAINTQVEITDVHEWDRYGARVTTRMIKAVQAYYRAGFGSPGDYLQATQAQPAALTGDSQPGIATKKILYVPRLSSAVGGYNLSARADVTANAANFAIPKAAASDPGSPPDYAASIGADAGGDLHGYIMGQRRNAGLGKPSSRSAATNTLFYFSSAEKLYGVALDALSGDALAGDVHVIVGFIAPWAEADADLTVPGVLVPNGKGGYYCYVATTLTLSGKAIRVPQELSGMAVTESLGDANATLLADAVTKDGVIISTAAASDVILEIG